MSSGGAIEIQIKVPGEGAFRHEFVPSESVVPMLPEFLETCRHHVRATDLQFEVDGIKVALRIEVDAQAIEEIRELAREFGIHEIERIWIGFTGASALVAKVRGRETRNETEIRRLTLDVGNNFWRENRIAQDDDTIYRGSWYTSSKHLDVFRRWIVHDGTWSIKVAVGPGVSHDVTKRIVVAVRDARLVDGRDPNDWNTQYFTIALARASRLARRRRTPVDRTCNRCDRRR